MALPSVAAAGNAAWDMYVAAYDGSGTLVWYHYTDAASAASTSAYSITPTAIASVQPALGGATTKTTIGGSFVYVVGNVATATAGDYADFGITKYPLECSDSKTVGQRDSSAAILKNMQDAPCAGLLQTLGSESDVFLVKYAALGVPGTDSRQPEVQYVRRTGQLGVAETATGIAVHDRTGDAFVVGTYSASSDSVYQSSSAGEKAYQLEQTISSLLYGDDDQYTATSSAVGGSTTTTTYSGDDHFGLEAARRVNSLGCPMQRFAPVDERAERLGMTGLPDCTLYPHSRGARTSGRTTGFVVKFSEKPLDTRRRGNGLVGKRSSSVTGRLSSSGKCGAGGLDTCQSSVAPCSSSSSGGPGETQQHVYTAKNGQPCSTYPRGGCSCLFLDSSTFSKKQGSGAKHSSSGAGLSNSWNGRHIRITEGRGAGYEGVISAYRTNSAANNVGGDHVYFTVPALAEVPDYTSHFQLVSHDGAAEPQSKIHLATCAGDEDAGCSAHGIEWAKTIGLPIGVVKQAGVGADAGPWKQVGKAGAGSTLSATGDIVDQIFLALDDLVAGASATGFYNDYELQLSADVRPPFVSVAVGEIVAGSYVQPTATSEKGGSVLVKCPPASITGTDNVQRDGVTACPLLATSRYRLVVKNMNGGGGGGGYRQESSPTAVAIVDGAVYVSGRFRGFDEYHFGVEGVDEDVGFRSAGEDTWEAYVVKLEE